MPRNPVPGKPGERYGVKKLTGCLGNLRAIWDIRRSRV
jgi:hypothetical protein